MAKKSATKKDAPDAPAAAYVAFSKAEFEAAFSKLVLAPKQGDELVYERQILTAKVKVYSSLDARTGISRDCGEDAIRIVVVDARHDVPLREKQPRVYRTAAAGLDEAQAKAALFDRLRDKCNILREWIRDEVGTCSTCGASIYVKAYKDKATGAERTFRACAAWKATGCKGRATEKAPSTDPKAIEAAGKGGLRIEKVREEEVNAPASVEAKPVEEAPVILTDEELVARYSKPGYTPSLYQARVFAAVEHGHGNVVIRATAGSGKTSTVVRALPLAKGRVAFCAFNKSIANEIKKRLPDSAAHISTLNSLGWGAVNKALGGKRVEYTANGRIRDFIKQILVSERGLDLRLEAIKELSRSVERLVSLAKATLTDLRERDAAISLIDRYGLDVNGDADAAIVIAADVLNRCKDFETATKLDFDDQIWLPVTLELAVAQYDTIFVDECQDLNLAQIRLLQRSLTPNGRIIAVGDANQACYSFRGADAEAVDRLINELKAEVLPLSISYRCPQAVVRLARQFVPEIEASAAAPEGEVRIEPKVEAALNLLAAGDMVLCRCNAPLVSVAFGLIRQGKKATIMGRDIGAGLIALIRKLGGTSIVDFLTRLNEYHTREAAKLEALDRPTDALDDKVDTLIALSDGAMTLADLEDKIGQVFSDDAVGVICSSIHRGKGLEADSVYILEPSLLPHPKAKKEWERKQEKNLIFIAVTRAKKRLTILGNSRFCALEAVV